jgi:hypothetical protein
VIGWETINGVHHLRTPGGIVRARAVGIATGAYTAQTLHPSLTSRVMPILSNSMVTRPLTQQEIAACNFRTKQVLTDTRTLRFYYRFLPDNRLQIGSRSAITGADASNSRHYDLLVEGMGRKFPALRGIAIDYSWWGWVDVSHDMMPRVFQPDPKQSVYYALGYGGNGVSYSQQAGRRLARFCRFLLRLCPATHSHHSVESDNGCSTRCISGATRSLEHDMRTAQRGTPLATECAALTRHGANRLVHRFTHQKKQQVARRASAFARSGIGGARVPRLHPHNRTAGAQINRIWR